LIFYKGVIFLEDTRLRNKKFSVWLFPEEYDILEMNAEKAEVSKSCYLRQMIIHGIDEITYKYTPEDSKILVNKLSEICNILQRIEYRIYVNGSAYEKDVLEMTEQMQELLRVVEDYVYS